MKLIKRTDPGSPDKGIQPLVMYGLHINDQNYVLAWTPDPKTAERLSEERARDVLRFYDTAGQSRQLEIVDAPE